MGASPGFSLVARAAFFSTWLSRFHPAAWLQTCPLHFRVQLGLMPEPRTLPLVVASVADVTPHMRRIQLSGSALDAFDYFPGQDLALGVVRDDGSIVRRRYTIRRFDAGRPPVRLEAAMHRAGPGIPPAPA